MLVVPLDDLGKSGDGTEPNFSRFSIADHGATVRFGRYEAASDAVLFERDPEFRRRLRAQRVKEERSFGASLRRLRLLRGLTQDDFGAIDRRTIQRLESGATAKPQAETLGRLAKVLKVKPREIEEY